MHKHRLFGYPLPKLIFTATIITGLLLTCCAVWFVSQINQNGYETWAQKEAGKIYAEFEQTLMRKMDLLQSVKGYYDVDSQISYKEFAAFYNALHAAKKQNENFVTEFGWIDRGAPPKESYILTFAKDQTTQLITYNASNFAENNYTGTPIRPLMLGAENKHVFLSIPTQAKPILDERDETIVFYEDGYILMAIDLEKIITDALQLSPGDIERFSFVLDESNPYASANDSELVLSETIDFYNDALSIKLYDHQPWRWFSRANSSVLWIIGLGLSLTLLVAFYIRDILRRNRIYHNALGKADTANRLKSEFLATMSHEIRSPMSGILGMAELLEQTSQTSEQKGYTRTILNSGEALLRIIQDILDFSKIEANKLEIEETPVDMLELVDEVCALYSPQAREKALELAVRYKPGTEQFVYADPVRMRQLLGNLVNNAIKFTQKGHITVTIGTAALPDLSPDQTGLYFEIHDTGVGIPDKAQARIFDKFVQADAATTRYYGGTGLGLTICKRLCEMMGGSISFDSEEGRGTTFILQLPFVRNTEATVEQPKPPALKDMKILIVDDLEIVCNTLDEQLSLGGMRCSMAESGIEALDLMKEAAEMGEPFDMILIDYIMPEMNGEMLARAISDEENLRGACLVMLTAAGMAVIGEDMHDKGFSACLSKPVKTGHLVTALAYIWEKYGAGVTDKFIEVETAGLFKRAEPQADEDKLEGYHILLAEDSRINQAFAEEVLSDLGCKVSIAANGQEALDFLEQETFDLVLMDCQMPIMDGFEAARQIRLLKKRRDVADDLPVIALTANAMEGDREKCLAAGMEDYLSKPVRRTDLRDCVKHWLLRREGEEYTPSKMPEDKAEITEAEDNIVPISASQKAGGIDPDLVDVEILNSARQTFKAKYGKMLEIYREDTEDYIHDMEQALAGDNINDAVLPAHTIKSSSRRMGAMRVAELAEEIEHAAKDMAEGARGNDKSYLEERLQKMAILFDQTLPFLKTGEEMQVS